MSDQHLKTDIPSSAGGRLVPPSVCTRAREHEPPQLSSIAQDGWLWRIQPFAPTHNGPVSPEGPGATLNPEWRHGWTIVWRSFNNFRTVCRQTSTPIIRRQLTALRPSSSHMTILYTPHPTPTLSQKRKQNQSSKFVSGHTMK